MKKRFLTFLLMLCFAVPVLAAHITGGEMIYEYLGAGSATGTKKYRITLKLFRDNNCTGCAAMPTSVIIGIFSGSALFSSHTVPQSSQTTVPVNPFPPCVQNAPTLSYNVAFFELVIDLPDNTVGYTASYQTCCRVSPLQNVLNSNGSGTGSTYACAIPPASTNSSPQFAMGISLICFDKKFTLDFSAVDPDGDVLVYSFCEAYGGGSATNANNIVPSPPPYASVPYINGFSSAEPLGTLATINSQTGIISGIAPAAGKYVVCVCIQEFRNGVKIGDHRKDFIVNVTDCDFAGAQLETGYSSCDGFTKTFENLNTSPQNNTFFWDFGVLSQTDDTSNSATPTFTYPDTGVYILKLVVNRGQACSDSATAPVKVFPGFFPGFTFTGICVNRPTQFTDTTKTVYGFVDTWAWDFGDVNTNADTSHLQNPAYTYTQLGGKNVRFIVTSSKGCIDTVFKEVNIIEKPPITLAFKDTLICSVDSVQLQASGSGAFSWTPLTNITNPSTATPVVSPNTTIVYYVNIDDNGCRNQDSVRVRVVDFVSLQALPDTTICQTDPAILGAVTNGLRFLWSPAATLSNPTLLRPIARPLTTTTYQITATIGSCNATDDLTVRVVPYPIADAGNDTTICFRTPGQLHGSMVGAAFSWSPAVSLLNANTLSPTAIPVNTTPYVLSVTDVIGCPKPGRDTVVVTVLPPMNAFAGNDTAVVVGEPLQLLATGGVNYIWSPPTYLSSVTIPDPVAIFSAEADSMRYRVIVTDGIGCIDSAVINVKIFKTTPTIFVPTAFTPNGDGRNDVVRPIGVGIRSIEYFRIYNRWGQLVFSTQINGHGWDGTIGGRPQGTNAYVWIVKGIDYLGRSFFQKGTVTLIR